MALRVWLPLNGSLENKGISNVEVINNGATINNNGKFGQCYNFNSNNIVLKNIDLSNISSLSVACWIKDNNTSSTQAIINCRTAVGNGLAIFLLGGKIRFDIGNANCTFDWTYNLSNWTHICCTAEGNVRKLYINGMLQQEKTVAATYTTFGTIGSIGMSSANTASPSGNILYADLNDFRLYDHCLSQKEVKEISQGLVLHYKLNGVSGGVGENILTGTATQTTLIANSSSTTTNATGKWGTASGGNGTHFIINIENDTPVFGVNWGFKITNNTSGNKDFCQHNQPYVNGVTYTVSWYMRGQGTYLVRQWNITDGKQMQSKTGAVNTTEWTYYTWTFTANEELETDACSLHLGATGNTPSLEWCAMKMEVGSIATPWTPSLSEMGINTTKITDSSGYENHSYLYNIYFVSEQGPRYNVIADFSRGGNIASAELSASKGNTVAFWCSAPDWSEYSLDGAVCQGTNWGITSRNNNLILELVSHRSAENSDYNLSQTYSWTLMPTSSLGTDWHYFVLTYLNHEIKFYLDGILYQTINNISTDIADYFYTNSLSLASLPVS